MAEPVKDIVSWDELEAARGRPRRALPTEPPPDVVLAISRGGLVPAGMLGYRLGWRDMLLAAVVVYDDEQGFRGHAEFLQFPRMAAAWQAGAHRGRGVGFRHDDRRRERTRPAARGAIPSRRCCTTSRSHSRVDLVPDHFVWRRTPGWSTRSRPASDPCGCPAADPDRSTAEGPPPGPPQEPRRRAHPVRVAPPEPGRHASVTPFRATLTLFFVNGAVLGTWVASIPAVKSRLCAMLATELGARAAGRGPRDRSAAQQVTGQLLMRIDQPAHRPRSRPLLFPLVVPLIRVAPEPHRPGGRHVHVRGT